MIRMRMLGFLLSLFFNLTNLSNVFMNPKWPQVSEKNRIVFDPRRRYTTQNRNSRHSTKTIWWTASISASDSFGVNDCVIIKIKSSLIGCGHIFQSNLFAYFNFRVHYLRNFSCSICSPVSSGFAPHVEMHMAYAIWSAGLLRTRYPYLYVIPTTKVPTYRYLYSSYA